MGILYHTITNPNYRPISEDELADYHYQEQEERIERQRWNKRAYKEMIERAEGFCPTCDSFTTNYNGRGECSECGTPVREEVEEE